MKRPSLSKPTTAHASRAGVRELARANRLASEKSPYLLQHARNPVHWFPWGDAAFEKARRENKPIFLSIGYSTCHWCHVMAHESFEDDATAAILNEHFVSIKLDREERPDVDRVYMTFVQATTGGGGWPMSVFLTPDLKPFYGGTYFPPEDRHGQPGFKRVLLRIAELWEKDRDKLLASSEQITRQLQQYTTAAAEPATGLNSDALDAAFEQFAATYEPQFGGFGGAPKFPRPVVLNFLLRYWGRAKNQSALEMTLHTLRKMADGGMHDHIGGGFHRYSVDARWHVPHFEKMLYDQAQLAISYLEAFQITHDKFFADTARDILDYVLRDMTGEDGNCFSAEDADSPLPADPAKHAEGAFYVWEKKKIENILKRGWPTPSGDKNVAPQSHAAEILCFHYGVKDNGNAPSDPHGEFTNKNILIVSHTIEETAARFGKSPNEISQTLAALRSTLFASRSSRPRPHLDDKTLTAWNGLMISAFARATQILDVGRLYESAQQTRRVADSAYITAAIRAARFIESRLFDKKRGKLLRRFRDGEAAIDGYCDDYAFLIQGLLDLYEASFDVHWLTWAIELQNKQNDLFWDNDVGGFFTTEGKDISVLLRMKDDYDGAEPSANSVSALNLLRLAQMTDNHQFREKAERTLALFSAHMQNAPTALPQMLCALDFTLSKPKQIVIAGKPDAPDTRAMLRAVHERFIPNKILLLADGGARQETLARFLPFLETVKPLDGKAAAYVCENYVCKLPMNEVEALRTALSPS